MSENLKNKAVSSAIWASIQKFMSLGIGFISSIILARLLTPEDYGCIGMLSIFMLIAASFIDGGFGSALIQKKKPTDEDYSTILWWNVAISLLMYIIIFASAPFIARFYRVELLCPVLRVQGIVLIFNALSAVQNNQLVKHFQFKKIAIITLTSSIISLTVTIILAYKGFGVWALVAQNLLTSILPAVAYWLSSKWRPMMSFSMQSFKELFSFGFFMFLSSVYTTLCNNIQGLLIGRLYNPSLVGYYSKAHDTEKLASTSISQIVTQVSYPLYAELQDEKSKLIYTIKKLTSLLAFVSIPLLSLLILLAEPIFTLLYSTRWLDSVPYFQILCFAGMAICLQGVNSQSIAAIGKSKVMMNWTIIKQTAGVLFVVVGLVLFGIKGLLIGMVIKSWLIYLVNAALVSKYIGYPLKKQLLDILPIFIVSFLSFVVSFFLAKIIPASNLYITACIQLVVFLLTYYCGSLLFKIPSMTECNEITIQLLSKLKRH